MADIVDIADGEAAPSVRTKLNTLILWVNKLINGLFVPASGAITPLTDGTSVSWDVGSADNKKASLASSNTTTTITFSNIVDTHTQEIIITPQSTATFTYTFAHAGLTVLAADEGYGSVAIDAISGKAYIFYASRRGTKLYIQYDSRPY